MFQSDISIGKCDEINEKIKPTHDSKMSPPHRKKSKRGMSVGSGSCSLNRPNEREIIQFRELRNPQIWNYLLLPTCFLVTSIMNVCTTSDVTRFVTSCLRYIISNGQGNFRSSMPALDFQVPWNCVHNNIQLDLHYLAFYAEA